MTLDRFLQFVMSHNATIIEILFGLTLLGVSFLAIRSFLLAKEPPGTGGSADMGNLESMLQQILEKAGQIPAAGAGAAAGSAASSEEGQRLLVEITNLKTDLETKQKQIEEMKTTAASSAAAAPTGMSAEEKNALDEKIRELQAKLSEYEIISEDIADLSFYKEQNVKLQKELDSLKAGGAVAAPAPAPPAPAPAAPTPEPAPAEAAPPPPPPPPPKEEPAIVGKATATSGAEANPAPAAVPELAIDDDLMAEFAAAVEKQKAPEASAAPASAPAAAAPAAEAPADSSDVDLGKMDMDKMMAEAAGIKSDGPDVSAEAALGTGLDENKLLQEAAALGSVSAEDKKLMGDFENFVKKGES